MAGLAATIISLIFTIVGGAESSIQTGTNATLGRLTSRGFAGLVSICTSVVCVLVFYLVDTYAVGTAKPDPARFRDVPWWAWTGGIHGIVYVLSAIICAPTLGAGTFTGISVCSMLIAAMLLDVFGLVGFARKQIPWQKTLGACLMVVGVVLMTVYTGAEVKDNKEDTIPEVNVEMVEIKD